MNAEAKSMQVIVLGSGSAVPDPLRGNPSIAVIVDGEPLLLDCGERATVNLVRAGINPLDVNNVLFTHLHWDHIADFNYFLMTVWNCGKPEVVRVFGPRGTQEMVDGFLAAHHVDIRFVHELVKKLPNAVPLNPQLDVAVTHIHPGVVLETSTYRVSAAEVQHLNSLGFEHADWAYRVDSEHGSVAYSGDTSPCDAMIELARDVDVLVHEAAFLDEIIDERAMQGHTSPRGAGRVAQMAGARKLVLTHLGPYDSYDKAIEMAELYYGRRRGPEIWSKILRDAASEYEGPIVISEDAMQITIGRDKCAD
jgi:ribonuclease Z